MKPRLLLTSLTLMPGLWIGAVSSSVAAETPPASTVVVDGPGSHEAEITRQQQVSAKAALAAVEAAFREPTRSELLSFYEAGDGVVFTEWTDINTDHRNWQEMTATSFYAVRSEGRVLDGRTEYRKGYRNILKTLPGVKRHARYSWTGMTHDNFMDKNRFCLSKGYTLTWVQAFVDAAGMMRYQALWALVPAGP